ncbi:hypothetical protein ACFQ0B_30235 [Nonomuraea thailandensis]
MTERRAMIRELHAGEEFAQVDELFERIWRFEPDGRPISAGLMRALSHAGNYVSGAFDGDRMIGASVGFFGRHSARRPTLHSNTTGVAAGRGRSALLQDVLGGQGHLRGGLAVLRPLVGAAALRAAPKRASSRAVNGVAGTPRSADSIVSRQMGPGMLAPWTAP